MSIQKRQVFYSTKGGHVTFFDWAIVTTGIGACVEPFQVNPLARNGDGEIADVDWSDIMVRVDEMHRVDDPGALKRALFFDETPLHGGDVRPHTKLWTGAETGYTGKAD